MRTKLSVVKAMWIGMLTITLVSITSIAAAWFIEKTTGFNASIERMRAQQYEYDKSILVNEVVSVLDYIEHSKSKTDARLRTIVRQRTLEAFSIAEFLYEQNAGSMPLADLQTLVIETLRPLRYADGQGYYFIARLDGVNLLSADRPELEGVNLLETGSQNVREVILDCIEICREDGEGFCNYEWTRPGIEGDNHPKIAFVKYFEPLDAFIGTGEYYENIEGAVKTEVLDRLDTITFVDGGYVFAGTFDGISLSGPAKGRNMIDIEDSNGVKIVQELIQRAREGGGFVQYVLPPLEEHLESAPKLSYTVPVKEWDWYIGAGKYISDIDAVIEEQRVAQQRSLLLNLLTIIGLALLLTCVVTFVSIKFRNHISVCFRTLTDFFHQAHQGVPELDPAEMRYAEFSRLVREASLLVEEREAIQRALIKSKDNYQQLVDTMEEGLILVDQSENIIFSNNSADRILGVTEGSLTGANLNQYMDADSFSLVQSKTSHRAQGETDSYELTITQPGGNHRRIQISVCPQFNEDKKFIGSLGTFHDVTDQRNLEQRVRQSQKMEAIGTLAGGIAHDFNNILFAILGYSHMIKDGVENTSREAEFSDEIIRAANRAADLVRQILSFAKQTTVTPSSIDLTQVISEVCRLIRATVPANIEIRKELGAQDAFVSGDAGQLHQVLMNLCTNACQAMSGGDGKLTVSTSRVEVSTEDAPGLNLPAPGSYVEMKVEDTGGGITREDLDRIFDPFFSTKEPGEGTGLGLSVVHGIITGMNGTISASSQLGAGSTFTILLPVGDQADTPVDRQEASVDFKGSGRILIVDDESSIVRLWDRILQAHGFETEYFTESTKAQTAFLADPGRFDLVITDQDMPGLTGGQMAAAMLAVNPAAKIILCTGYSSVFNKEDADTLGIAEYLIKPVSKNDMLRAVQSALKPSRQNPG